MDLLDKPLRRRSNHAVGPACGPTGVNRSRVASRCVRSGPRFAAFVGLHIPNRRQTCLRLRLPAGLRRARCMRLAGLHMPRLMHPGARFLRRGVLANVTGVVLPGVLGSVLDRLGRLAGMLCWGGRLNGRLYRSGRCSPRVWRRLRRSSWIGGGGSAVLRESRAGDHSGRNQRGSECPEHNVLLVVGAAAISASRRFQTHV